MLKIRRDRLIFNMGIPIPGKYGLYIETGPRSLCYHLAGSKLYERLCKYTHSPNELSRFAYPRPVLNEPGKVTIKVPEADVHKVSPTRKSVLKDVNL